MNTNKALIRTQILIGLLSSCTISHAVVNARLLEFSGQTISGSSSSATVTNTNGLMTITPYSGEDFRVGDHTYVARNPGYPTGTTYTIKPVNSIFYELGVSDQRTSSTQYISGKCIDPVTLSVNSCDFGNTSLFPRYFNPPSGGAYSQTANAQWDSTNKILIITTPGPGNQNIQSNGLRIGLPPYVQEITFRATNYGNADAIFGDVRVADAPSIKKSFSPQSIKPGERTTLTITVTNPDLKVSIPNTNLIDELPTPLKIVSATHNCVGGNLQAVQNTSQLNLISSTIPATGCEIKAEIEWPDTADANNFCASTSTITNTITPPTQFNTALGQATDTATAELHCTAKSNSVTSSQTQNVPLLDETGVFITIALLGILKVRRSKKESKQQLHSLGDL